MKRTSFYFLCLIGKAFGLNPTALAARQSLIDTLRDCVPEGRYTCTGNDARRIVKVCETLEKAAPECTPGFPRDLMLMDGEWQLAYSSNVFQAGGTVLPLLPDFVAEPFLTLAAGSPFSPRDVSQSIDVLNRRIVNSVTLNPWPDGVIGEALSQSLSVIGGVLSKLEDASVRLDLDHTFKVDGDGTDGGARQWAASSEIRMQLRSVKRRLSGMDDSTRMEGPLGDAVNLFAGLIPTDTAYDLPEFFADLPDVTNAGVFATTYVDPSLRISRGASARQELRIFVRDVIEEDGDVGEEWLDEVSTNQSDNGENEMDFLPSD